MVLRILGDICIGLAILIYALLPAAVAAVPKGHEGGDPSFIFALVPLWLLLIAALCVSTANGGLEWLPLPRGAQYATALAAGLAMAVAASLSGILRYYSPNDTAPWVMRALVPSAWPMWLFPLVVMAFCLFTINAGPAAAPPLTLRLPVGLVGGISLLVGCGLMVQWAVDSQRQQQAMVEAEHAREAARLQSELDAVDALDATHNIGQLLGYAGDKNPPVRQRAIAKLRAFPDLQEQLAACLRNAWFLEALIYLTSNDPPDPKALAEPARDAFLKIADRVREGIRQANTTHSSIWPESFELESTVVLTVADKFRGFGVDYAPAIRAVRSALDEPLDPKLKFNCAGGIDDWLARHATATK